MTTPDRSADINAIGAGFASFNGIMASILSMSALGYLNEFVMIFAYHLAVPYGTPALHQKLWDRYGDEKEASPSGSFEIVFLAAFSLSTIISSLIFLSIFPQDWSPMRFGTVDVILAVVALGVMTFGSRTRLPLHKAAKILEDQQLRLKIALGGSAFLYPQLVSLRSSGGFALYLTLCGAMMYLGTSVSTAVIRVVFFVLLARVIFTYISYYRGIPIAQKRIPLAQVIAGFGSMMIGHTDGVLDHVSSILLCIVIFTFLRALSNYLAYTSVYLKDRRFSGVKGRARGGPPGAWDDIFYDSIYIMHSRGLSDNKMSILLFGSFALLSLGYCHNHVTSLVELNILAGGVVFFFTCWHIGL